MSTATAARSSAFRLSRFCLFRFYKSRRADFDFDINILDAVSSGTVESFDYGEGKIDQKNENKRAFWLRASLASRNGSHSEKSEQQLSANMKVHIKMRQADVPAGLSNMLRLTASNLQVEDAEPTDETEPDKTE